MFYFFCLALLFVTSSNGQSIDPVRQPPLGRPTPTPISRPEDERDNGPEIHTLASPTDKPYNNLLIPVDSREVELPPPNKRDRVCALRNGFYKENGNCDTYLECRNFQTSRKTCPDGMHFNPYVQWPEYPCGYPQDVPCLGRGAIQPANPTAECPRQYGFYPSEKTTPQSCGNYKMCVAGIATAMKCPVGLTFNPAIGRCDWPELVPSCNVDDFFGFKCPRPPTDRAGQPLNIVQNYRYPGECYYFFSCQGGRARLLSCDFGLAFDVTSGRCVGADLVQCNGHPTHIRDQ